MLGTCYADAVLIVVAFFPGSFPFKACLQARLSQAPLKERLEAPVRHTSTPL